MCLSRDVQQEDDNTCLLQMALHDPKGIRHPDRSQKPDSRLVRLQATPAEALSTSLMEKDIRREHGSASVSKDDGDEEKDIGREDSFTSGSKDSKDDHIEDEVAAFEQELRALRMHHRHEKAEAAVGKAKQAIKAAANAERRRAEAAKEKKAAQENVAKLAHLVKLAEDKVSAVDEDIRTEESSASESEDQDIQEYDEDQKTAVSQLNKLNAANKLNTATSEIARATQKINSVKSADASQPSTSESRASAKPKAPKGGNIMDGIKESIKQMQLKFLDNVETMAKKMLKFVDKKRKSLLQPPDPEDDDDDCGKTQVAVVMPPQYAPVALQPMPMN
eukprot:gnl/TRDRNA2_/TRDRNA2_126142_c0_seq1.p1 gnl/TRDRNA2_/TRDRNA2_126142_c0~~gnl/TRDRNA2_/TRDRNA2_126142_c0_seq1.p1  ORF type:complete len:365 (+),score=92.32 gnl/TRDRNA2_/TRDRNA2_126142_c0_seq1:94-1095(+)